MSVLDPEDITKNTLVNDCRAEPNVYFNDIDFSIDWNNLSYDIIKEDTERCQLRTQVRSTGCHYINLSMSKNLLKLTADNIPLFAKLTNNATNNNIDIPADTLKYTERKKYTFRSYRQER